MGSMAVQLASWAGAQVIASVSSDEQAERALSLGAHIAVNRHKQDVAALVLQETKRVGVHRVIELAFEEDFDLDLRMLANDGVLVHYGATQATFPIPIHKLMAKGITLRFVLVYAMSDSAHANAVRDSTAIVAQGRLKVYVGERFRLEALSRAYKSEESGKADGRS